MRKDGIHFDCCFSVIFICASSVSLNLDVFTCLAEGMVMQMTDLLFNVNPPCIAVITRSSLIVMLSV